MKFNPLYLTFAGVLALTGCGQKADTQANAPAQSEASANAQTATQPAPSADTTTATPEGAKPEGLKQVRIATESNYKPFSYLDNEGNHQGFEIDLIHGLCREMKADCTISSQDWDSLIPGLTANKYDAIFASMSATDERRKVVNFSDPYFNNKLVLVGKKGEPASIDDVDGKNIAVQQATVSAKYLADNKPKAVVKTYDKQVNAYLDLSAGRVSFLLSDIAPALDWLKTEQGSNFEIKGKAIDINDNVAIALRQEDTELAKDFNAALATLKQNGEYDKLIAQYFDLQALGSASQ